MAIQKVPIPADWDGETWATGILCYPDSPQWKSVISGVLYMLCRGRRWDETTGNIKAVQETANTILEGFEEMSNCSVEFDRIASSLESIDSKMAARITYDEMIDDLEDALGIGNVFVEAIKIVGNMIPSIRAKLDMTPLILDFWEWWRWKLPILTLLTGMNASLGGLAAAALTEAPLSIIRTVLEAFNSALALNNRIYEFLLGNWNWWDDVLKPIIQGFISDEEGGTGGDNPDGEGGRIQTFIANVMVEGSAFSCAPNLTVNCGGAGNCGACDEGGSTGLPLLEAIPEDTEPDPETGFTLPDDGLGTPAYGARKCAVANWLIDSLLAALTGLRDFNFAQTLTMGIGAATICFSMVLTLVSGPVLIGLSVVGALAAIVAVFMAYTIDLDEIISVLEENREKYICIFYNATSPECIDPFCAELQDDGVSASGLMLVRAILSVKALQFLFHTYTGDGGASVEANLLSYYLTTTCEDCADEGYFNFALGEMGWIVFESMSTSPEYVPTCCFQGCRGGVGDAKIAIYWPEKVNLESVRILSYGWGGQMTEISILSSDDMLDWTPESYHTFVVTDGETWEEFNGLEILDKYVMVYCRRFLSNPCAQIRAIEFVESEE